MKHSLALLLLLSIPAHAGLKLSGVTSMIARNTTGTDGQLTTAGGMILNTTVGEVGISSAASSGLRLYPGYIKLAQQPGSVISITAVTKSTGDLELSWVTPGFDGFKGDVSNGFYRVDYSSDSLHVFAPTTFQLEFSTTVVASSTQALTIHGLLPNTTYFTKIYLADNQKYFAEDSHRSEESTLANIPVNPVFSNVSACNVTITWNLPASGAEAYRLGGSTTNFGALFPGGDVFTSSTSNGTQLNLTLSGLNPSTTYFFKVASLNWQGDSNFTTVMSAVTPPGICGAIPPVTNLFAATNAFGRTVNLTWDNPSSPSPQGILVMLSTSPVVTSVADGLAFNPGQILNDSSVVKSTVVAISLQDGGLALDTTYYYSLFAQYVGPTYSVSVSTSIFLDLPPMAAAGMDTVVNSGRTQITLNWHTVTSNLDGSLFPSTAAPRSVELDHYRVDRATSVLLADWVQVATLPVTAQTYTDNIPNPNQTYIYRVVALDSFGTSDVAMAVDTDQNLYAFAQDKVTRLKVSSSLIQELRAGTSPLGTDILVRAMDEPSDGTQNIFKSVRFKAFESPTNKAADPIKLSKPGVQVALRYDVAGNRIVPSGAPPSTTDISIADAPNHLGMYWDNGSKYVKLYGDVDPLSQTLTVQTAMTGGYQIRSLYRESGVTFDLSGQSNKVITPNGDGINDLSVFTFDNPKDSAFSGKIYDMEGGFVADMAQGPIPNSLQWDGKSSGRSVSGGVYVYQIRAEGRTFSGTLVVIR